MRKPSIGKPRTGTASLSLSRRLPKLSLPASAAPGSLQRPKPQVGKPRLATLAARVGRKG